MTPVEFANWIGSADTGISSESIAIAAMGGDRPERWGWGYPSDPSDFGRCARLLAKHPEIRQPAFERLKVDGGKVWARLIRAWDEIHKSMDDEVGIDWSKGKSAPKTYKLMQHIISARDT